MSRARVITESRAYDAIYDSTYIGPYNNSNNISDTRVLLKNSSSNVVTGTSRYKYFRRPVMPQINAISPQILLAPTSEDPLIPIEEEVEPSIKNVEVQTMYRESEVQTNPYTPNYIIPEGEDPEILLLKDLTYEKGLPLGIKEYESIKQARIKKLIESNVPPFTDEASLHFRKTLMERQELKEFQYRENEIDIKREERLNELKFALIERNESNEFLIAQRVEAVRQNLIENREKILNNIRSKRVKVLRRLAIDRNKMDEYLQDTSNSISNQSKHNIIDEHYNKSSHLYAPKLRLGKEYKINRTLYNVFSRTTPLNNITSINEFEQNIPKKIISNEDISKYKPNIQIDNNFSKTTNYLYNTIIKLPNNNIVNDRLTSSVRRNLRNTKRDVEELYKIINKKKTVDLSNENINENVRRSSTVNRSISTEGMSSLAIIQTPPHTNDLSKRRLSLLSKKQKGRPNTPDITVNSLGERVAIDTEYDDAIYLIQKIIRGRAIQNIMMEGRFKHKELISEFRKSQEYLMNKVTSDNDASNIGFVQQVSRDSRLKETTMDAYVGGAVSNLLYKISTEQNRIDYLELMQRRAYDAIAERIKVEAAEAGRRQKEGLVYPKNEDNI